MFVKHGAVFQAVLQEADRHVTHIKDANDSPEPEPKPDNTMPKDLVTGLESSTRSSAANAYSYAISFHKPDTTLTASAWIL